VVDHLRGNLTGDRNRFVAAVEALSTSERPLLHASALEDLGGAFGAAGCREQAIDNLGAAFDLYVLYESTADARRVARSLHAHGVERRISRQRERTGWESLTRAEWRVADLVADGATNRQVAEHLSVSHHTVNTHLRNVYGKLGVRSRDQLTRLARGESATRSAG
jgi:DNA-binding CsgD family transcriptional regulator